MGAGVCMRGPAKINCEPKSFFLSAYLSQWSRYALNELIDGDAPGAAFNSLALSQGLFKFHQYQVVGRHLPTESEPSPVVYRMKIFAEDVVKAKSKFW